MQGRDFLFLAAAASGIVLFLRPEGSLASWAGWHVLGIDKKGWEGVHILSVIMFVVFAAAAAPSRIR